MCLQLKVWNAAVICLIVVLFDFLIIFSTRDQSTYRLNITLEKCLKAITENFQQVKKKLKRPKIYFFDDFYHCSKITISFHFSAPSCHQLCCSVPHSSSFQQTLQSWCSHLHPHQPPDWHDDDMRQEMISTSTRNSHSSSVIFSPMFIITCLNSALEMFPFPSWKLFVNDYYLIKCLHCQRL